MKKQIKTVLSFIGCFIATCISIMILCSSIIVDNTYVAASFLKKITRKSDDYVYCRITPSDDNTANIASLDERNGYDINKLFGGGDIKFLYEYDDTNMYRAYVEGYEDQNVHFLSATNYEYSSLISFYGFNLIGDTTIEKLEDHDCYISKSFAKVMIGDDNYESLIGKTISFYGASITKTEMNIKGIVDTESNYFGTYIFVPYRIQANSFRRTSITLMVKKPGLTNSRFVINDLLKKYPIANKEYNWSISSVVNNVYTDAYTEKFNETLASNYYTLRIILSVASISLSICAVVIIIKMKLYLGFKQFYSCLPKQKAILFDIAYFLSVFIILGLTKIINHIFIFNYVILLSNELSFFVILIASIVIYFNIIKYQKALPKEENQFYEIKI